MSWADRYRQQHEAWRCIAERHAAAGNTVRATEADACAKVYKNLLERAELLEAPSASAQGLYQGKTTPT